MVAFGSGGPAKMPPFATNAVEEYREPGLLLAATIPISWTGTFMVGFDDEELEGAPTTNLFFQQERNVRHGAIPGLGDVTLVRGEDVRKVALMGETGSAAFERFLK